MAFRDLRSIADVQRQYQIVYQEDEFVTPIPLPPSAAFLEKYEFSAKHLDVLASEAARCENIIYPILRDVYKHHAQRLSLGSHKTFRVDDTLAGAPDYLVALRSPLGKTVLERPLLVVVEAKQSDFEAGWGQCRAEMVAAQKFNGDERLTVYGVVTDGQLWQFAKLEGRTFKRNTASAAASDLERLFGCLNYLFQSEAVAAA